MAEKLTQEVGIQKRFAACKVEFLHSCFFQKPQSAFGLTTGEDGRSLFNVKAESAFVVALARELLEMVETVPEVGTQDARATNDTGGDSTAEMNGRQHIEVEAVRVHLIPAVLFEWDDFQ